MFLFSQLLKRRCFKFNEPTPRKRNSNHSCSHSRSHSRSHNSKKHLRQRYCVCILIVILPSVYAAIVHLLRLFFSFSECDNKVLWSTSPCACVPVRAEKLVLMTPQSLYARCSKNLASNGRPRTRTNWLAHMILFRETPTTARGHSVAEKAWRLMPGLQSRLSTLDRVHMFLVMRKRWRIGQLFGHLFFVCSDLTLLNSLWNSYLTFFFAWIPWLPQLE